MKYTKPPKSFAEQLALLKERGLQINDDLQAIHYLKHLNYYRLSAYWLPYESSRDPHKFIAGSTFDDVLRDYVFDRQLRVLLLDAIERIEISFRTQWAYYLSHHYGAYGFLEYAKGLIKDRKLFEKNKKELLEHVDRSNEIFITHYKKKYDENRFPPAWMCCEIMSLGLLSRFYSNLRAYKVRQEIARAYHFDDEFLEGFFEHITYVRNLCAHHARVWNQTMKKLMPLPKNKPQGLKNNINDNARHKIYNTIVVIVYLLDIICENSEWKMRFINLMKTYRIDPAKIGALENWQELPIWSST